MVTQATKSTAKSPRTTAIVIHSSGPVRRPVWAGTAADDDQDQEWPAEGDEAHGPEQEHTASEKAAACAS